MSSTDKRQFERFVVDRDFEIFVNGYVVELPARDISVRGIGIDSCGTRVLRPGDICMITLTDDLEVTARVVRSTDHSLHFEFSGSSDVEIAHFIALLISGE